MFVVFRHKHRRQTACNINHGQHCSEGSLHLVPAASLSRFPEPQARRDTRLELVPGVSTHVDLRCHTDRKRRCTDVQKVPQSAQSGDNERSDDTQYTATNMVSSVCRVQVRVSNITLCKAGVLRQGDTDVLRGDTAVDSAHYAAT